MNLPDSLKEKIEAEAEKYSTSKMTSEDFEFCKSFKPDNFKVAQAMAFRSYRNGASALYSLLMKGSRKFTRVVFFDGEYYVPLKTGEQMKAQLEAQRMQIEELKNEGTSPYCPTCGICGEDGCCKVEKCLYPNIKSETVKENKEFMEQLYAENAKLRDDIQNQKKSRRFSGRTKMKIINFISTLATIMVFCYCWGMYAKANDISTEVAGTVSFLIGFFGSNIIYSWLNKSNTPADPE